MKTFRLAGSVLLPLGLVACGGGGGGSTTTAVTPTPKTILVSTTVTAGSGSFTPISANLTAGQTTSFVLTPATGFSLATATGCGGTLTGQTFQTSAVTSACTVSATFTPLVYNLTATAGTGGTISPSSLQVTHGQAASFTLTPDTDYIIAQVSGCGGSLTGNSYQISAVNAACAVTATFSKNMINLTTTAGPGGSISPTSDRVVSGGSRQLTVTPNAGYEITSVTGCNGVLTENIYRTGVLTQDCTVTARFNLTTEAVFPDAALNTAVRQALGLNSSESVLKTRLANLTSLQLSNLGVQQLTGLQHASNLRRLFANNNNIVDLSPLKNLSALTDLQLRGNPLQDLTPLAGLSLQTIDLAGTKVSDIEPLGRMPLLSIDLSSSRISSLNALKNISALRVLSANYTLLADVAPLATATQLRQLYVADTRIAKLEPLLSSGLKQTGALLRVSGCIDTQGFSRGINVINELTAVGADARLSNTPDRNDCPDTLGQTQMTASSYQENEKLGLSWQISNAPDDGDWACEVHVDLQTDVARVPLQKISSCRQASQQLLTLSTRQNSYQLSMLFDNGLGGEKIIKLSPSVATGASPVLAGLDFGQVVMKSNPLLVPEREALMRLHVIAANAPVQIPAVTVEASGVGAAQTLTAKAPAQIPVTVNYQSLNNSYQVQLPAALMRAGLQLSVRVNGELLRTVVPAFASQNKLAVLLVPFTLGSGNDASTASLPEPTTLATQIKSLLPLANVDVRTRAPYQLKSAVGATTAYTMLAELADLRAAENGSVYYYGYFKSAMGDGCCGGLGYLPGYAAVGVDTDLTGQTMVHELGHNLSLQHINCGNPTNFDGLYPYAGNSIGSLGINAALTELRQPNSFRDVMSYCSPKHISDYHYEKAQDYLIGKPSPAFPTAAAYEGQQVAALTERTLYVSGSIDSTGQLQIRTLLPVNRAPEYYPPSEWQFILVNSAGERLEVQPLMLAYGHPTTDVAPAKPDQPFQFEVPFQDIIGLELWHAGHLQSKIDVQAQALAASVMQADIEERNNEVCLRWQAQPGLALSLLHHQSAEVTALALNESSGQFCRDSQTLSSGGEWQLLWRRGLMLEEQWVTR